MTRLITHANPNATFQLKVFSYLSFLLKESCNSLKLYTRSWLIFPPFLCSELSVGLKMCHTMPHLYHSLYFEWPSPILIIHFTIPSQTSRFRQICQLSYLPTFNFSYHRVDTLFVFCFSLCPLDFLRKKIATFYFCIFGG